MIIFDLRRHLFDGEINLLGRYERNKIFVVKSYHFKSGLYFANIGISIEPHTVKFTVFLHSSHVCNAIRLSILSYKFFRFWQQKSLRRLLRFCLMLNQKQKTDVNNMAFLRHCKPLE